MSEECVRGLGQIGSATAVSALLKAERVTNGPFRATILSQLKEVKDTAAIPMLVNVLELHPVISDVFAICIETV